MWGFSHPGCNFPTHHAGYPDRQHPQAPALVEARAAASSAQGTSRMPASGFFPKALHAHTRSHTDAHRPQPGMPLPKPQVPPSIPRGRGGTPGGARSLPPAEEQRRGCRDEPAPPGAGTALPARCRSRWRWRCRSGRAAARSARVPQAPPRRAGRDRACAPHRAGLRAEPAPRRDTAPPPGHSTAAGTRHRTAAGVAPEQHRHRQGSGNGNNGTGTGNRGRGRELDSESAPGTLTRNRNRRRKPALPTAGSCGHHWEWGLAPAGSGKWERCQLALVQELGITLVNWEPCWEPGSRSNIAWAPRHGIIQKMGPSVGTGAGTVLGREQGWGTGATLTPAAPAGNWNWDQHMYARTLTLASGTFQAQAFGPALPWHRITGQGPAGTA